MTGESVTEIDRFIAPWGKEVVLQEVAYEGGLKLLRMRVREGRRFTVVDLDAETAAHWGRAMVDWAAAQDPINEPAMPGKALRRKYDRIARLYDILDLPFEYRRYRPLRRRLFEGVSGTVLDAGVGTGRNMECYPVAARMVGIDLSPAMLARAKRRRARLGIEVELHEMDVLNTGFPDRHFDAIVATFLFCVLEENQQLPALRELARICKPTGSIRLLEYVYSRDPVKRATMRLWVPWVRWAYGAAFDRNTESYVPGAGLDIVDSRFLFHDIIKLIVARPSSASGR
jgi:ubiquinone/menaquinone biosynthesis C-methylase UbiE